MEAGGRTDRSTSSSVLSRCKEVAHVAYNVGNTMILYRSGSDDEVNLIPPDVVADLHQFLNRRRYDVCEVIEEL